MDDLDDLHQGVVYCDVCSERVPSNLYPSHLLQCLQSNALGHAGRYHTSHEAYEEFFELGSEQTSNLQSTIHRFFQSIQFDSVQLPTQDRPFVLFEISAVNLPSLLNNEYEFNTMLEEMIGNVEVGLTEEDINNVSILLPNSVYKTEVCAICLDKFEESKNNIRRLLCNHIFCNDCINQWWQKSKKCPCCNVNVLDAYDHAVGIDDEKFE
jgi:hypothetical protein